jgi:putative membrane protein
MMGGFDGGMMGDWGAFGWLWMLLPLLFWGGLLALIAWAVVRIFPARRGEGGYTPGAGSAEETLRERFARGEISVEEYEERLRILRGEVGTGTLEAGKR